MSECEYCGEDHKEEEESISPIPWNTKCINVDDIRDRQLEEIYTIRREQNGN